MSYSIHLLTADPAMIGRLLAMRIRSTAEFLLAARTMKDRQSLAARLGIPLREVTSMANAASMMRIRRIGAKHVAALRAVGVDTVRELAVRDPERLRRKIAGTGFLEFPPPKNFVVHWIDEAKTIDPIITY